MSIRTVRSLFLLATVSWAVACAVACGGSTPGGSTTDGGGGGGGNNVSANNLSACQAYVTAFNSLSCVPAAAKLTTSTACPASLATNGCNAVPYFDCVRGALRCMTIGGISVIDSSGIQNCVNNYPCH